MSEVVDTLDAGTLEVDVVSETKGFGKKLQEKLDRQTKDVAAKVGIDLRKSTKKLRKELQAKVDEVAVGVSATIGINVDPGHLRLEIQNAAQQAALGVMAEIGITVNDRGLRDEVRAAAAAAGQDVKSNVDVDVDEHRSPSFRDRLREFLRRSAKDNDAHVGVKIDPKDAKKAADEAADVIEKTIEKRNIWRRIFQRKPGSTGKTDGGDVPDAPDDVDLIPGDPGGGGRRASSLWRTAAMMYTKFASLLSLVQPLVAAIGGAGAGLVAMAGSLGTAVGTLAVVPALISGLGLALGAAIIAFSGLTGEVDKMPPSMKEARKAFEALKDEWTDFRKNVQENFWKQWADQIEPIGEKLLPVLSRELGRIAKELGNGALDLTKWLGSEKFEKDLGKITDSLVGKDGKKGFLGSLRTALFGVEESAVGAGDAQQGLIQFLSDLMVATGPLLERFGRLIEKFGLWTGTLLDSEDERDRFAAWLDRAADRGAVAGEIIGNLASALAGIFRAGGSTGDNLLAKLLDSTRQFDTWVNGAGYTRIQEFFKSIEPTTEAMGHLFVELAKGLGKLVEDPNVATMLRQIADELLPALVNMLQQLGQNLGPKVIDLIAEFVETLSHLAQDGTLLTSILHGIGGFFSLINDVFTAHPDLAKAVSGIVTSLLLLKGLQSLTGAGGVLGMLGNLFSALGSSKGSNPGGFIDKLKESFSNEMRVTWAVTKPVYLTNKLGQAVSGDGTVIADGDGKNDKDKDKDKNTRDKNKGLSGLDFLGFNIPTMILAMILSLGGDSRQTVDPDKDYTDEEIAELYEQGKTDREAREKESREQLEKYWGWLPWVETEAERKAKEEAKKKAPITDWDPNPDPFNNGNLQPMFPGGGGGGGGMGFSPTGAIPAPNTLTFTEAIRQAKETGLTYLRDFKTRAPQEVDAPIASTAQRIGDAFANSLPKPVQNALTNLGVFKKNANGSVSVDLTGPAKKVGDSLANALPTPVQNALTNLGVFKKNADGSVSVDLGGAGKRAGDTLANALPTPVQNALTNLGVFKKNADGSVSTDLGGAAKKAGDTLANGLPAPVRNALTNLGVFKKDAGGKVDTDLGGAGRRTGDTLANSLPGPVRSALGHLRGFKTDAPGTIQGLSLYSIGSSIINSLKNGITSGYDKIRQSLQWLTDKIPTWKGPAERDATLLDGAGKLIIGGLLSSMEGEYDGVRASLQAFTSDLAGTDVAWNGTANATLSAAANRGRASDLLDASGARQGVTFLPGSVTIHNPVAEPAGESIATVLREAAFFGFGDGE